MLSVGLAVSLVEALNTTCGVNKLLCACEEGVACRADFNVQILCSCLCLDDVTAGAVDLL